MSPSPEPRDPPSELPPTCLTSPPTVTPAEEAPGTGAVPPTVPLQETPASAAPPSWPGGRGRLEDYQIEEEVGRGGVGVVYKARDTDLNRTLAVKVLKEEHRGQPELERRFLEEAQLTAQLQHPGIPPVHEVGRARDGRPFFAMKLIKGRNFARLLEERESPADGLPRFLAIFGQACQTLAYAHSQGVIHRDLKPPNVMVGAFGEVQVMDWGLAKTIAPDAGEEIPAAQGAAEELSTLYTVRTRGPRLAA